jgi:hypothetical protein
MGELRPVAASNSPESCIMLRCSLPLCAIAFSLAFVLPAARAANVKIDVVSATPYTEYITLHAANSQPTGAIEKYTPAAGQTLWLVTFRTTPEWDEATENLNFDSESFGLYDGNTKVEHLGGMSQFGVVDRYVSPPYHYRPDNWKTEKALPRTQQVWVSLPKGKTELVLRLTQLTYDKADMNAPPKKTPYTATVKLSGEPKPYDINDHVEVKVRAVKMITEIEDKDEYDRGARGAKIINDGGSIMQLTVQITPKQANTIEEKESTFVWSPGWVGLSFGKGGRAVCIGTRQYGRISADSSESIKRTDGDIWDSKTVSLYFPVPSNLKSFDVTFLGQKVGSGAVP